MGQQLRHIFFRGLVTLLPVAITIYIVYSAIAILDSLLGSILRAVLPAYIPGLGLLTIIAIIFVFGLMLNNLVTERIFAHLERKLLAVPFIKTVYSPLRDLMNLFSKTGQQQLKHVVMVKLGSNDLQMLGLMTRENFHELKLGSTMQDKVAVYFPFSYALGGFTLIVSKSQIQELDMPVDKAMSLAITAWIKAEAKEKSLP
jgi:uncharacterized membrane protein